MKRTWSMLAAVLLASGVAFGQAAPVAPPAARPGGLPEGVLAIVEFGNLEALQTHMGDFANATGLIPPGQPVPSVLEVFASSLHSTDVSQIDATQPARFVFVKAGPRKAERVLQCTVKDPAAYLTTLEPTLVKGEEKDGVTSYTDDKKTVAIGASGKIICVGDSATTVGQVLALVKSGALPQGAMLQGGDVVASLDVKALLNHMADEKGLVFSDLKEKVKSMSASTPGGPEQAQKTARMLEAEIDALEVVVRQFDRATVTATPDAQQIKISAKAEPIQDSMLAAYLATVPAGIPATLKYMPADSFAVCSFKMGNLDPLWLPLLGFNMKIMAAGGVDPVQAALLFNQFVGVFKAIGDEMTFAVRSGNGIRAIGAMSLKDPEVFKAMLQKMPELSVALAGIYKTAGMPMQVQTEVVKYNNTDITQMKWTVAPEPAAGATPQQPAADPQQKAMMQAMFGEGMPQDMAILGKDEIVTMGSDSLDTVKQIADGKLEKLTDREDFKQSLAQVPPESCGFCLVHLTGLAEFGMSLARTIGHLPIPEINFPHGPGVLAIFVTAPAGSSVTCNVSIPAAEIKAIADGFKSLQGAPPAATPGMTPPAMPPVQPAPAPESGPSGTTSSPTKGKQLHDAYPDRGKIISAVELHYDRMTGKGGLHAGFTFSLNDRGIFAGTNGKSGWVSIDTTGRYSDQASGTTKEVVIKGVSFWVNRGGSNWWDFEVDDVTQADDGKSLPFETKIEELKSEGKLPVIILMGKYKLVPIGDLNTISFQESK